MNKIKEALLGKMAIDWMDALMPFFINNLDNMVTEIAKDEEVFPKRADIFNAFYTTSYKEVRVVLVGQDPYPGVCSKTKFPHAHGYCFSTLQESTPKSLKPIKLAIKDQFGVDTSSNLTTWATQGVLMLNTALTVKKGSAGSHSHIWKGFTNEVVELLQEKEDLIWMLWGNDAKAFKKQITNPTHKVFEDYHPCAGQYNKSITFNGRFSDVNKYMTDRGEVSIFW